MQAFCCEVARALMKLGMAIAANRPMMATTIIISTSVKPALREVLFVFILCFLALLCGVNVATGGLFIITTTFTDCPLQPQLKPRVAHSMPKSRKKSMAAFYGFFYTKGA